MRASIPHDVLVSIFHWADRSTLRALSLASTECLTIADPLLYQRVELCRPIFVDRILYSICARGGYRACFVTHLVIIADTCWPALSSISVLLERLRNLHSFVFSHPAVRNISLRFPPPLPTTLRKLQVPHLVLLDRQSGVGTITHLRIGDTAYCPNRSARRSCSLFQNIEVLSSGCTLRSIVRFAPMMKNLDCWELNGDGLALDGVNSSRQVILAIASTRVRCLRFIRHSYACERSFLVDLFNSIPRLECIEFTHRSLGHGNRFYREAMSKAVSVKWLCEDGQWWQHDWQKDVQRR